MWDKEKQILIANHLEKYEKLLSEIYKIFATKFPDLSSFWNKISAEETTHAFMVATLKTMIHDGSQFFDNRDYQLPDILKYIDELKAYISDIKENDTTIESAIKFALYVEGLSIERDIFKIMEGDSEEVKRTLNILYKDTMNHYNRIKNLQKNIIK